MARKGWHSEDIKAAVRKTGVTLSDLALAAGLTESACRVALKRPHWDAEMAIAERIGVSPRELWPQRYERRPQPRRSRKASQVMGVGDA